MITTLKIKNNAIQLPVKLGKKLENKRISISDQDMVIILKIESEEGNGRKIRDSLKNAAGILKGKNIDPLKYQRKIRAEWDERQAKLEKQYAARH